MLKQYIGSKQVQAEPADKQGTPGYMVVYEDGYVSWSPKEAFDKAYREVTGLSFGLALEALKKGLKVARLHWAHDKWIEFHFPQVGVDKGYLRKSYAVNSRLYPEGARVPWTPSQEAILADDWVILE
jgi:hypothetical protein